MTVGRYPHSIYTFGSTEESTWEFASVVYLTTVVAYSTGCYLQNESTLSQSLSCSSAKSEGNQAKILKKTKLGAERSSSLMNYWLLQVNLSVQKRKYSSCGVTIILFVHCPYEERTLSLVEQCPTDENFQVLTAASLCALYQEMHCCFSMPWLPQQAYSEQ